MQTSKKMMKNCLALLLMFIAMLSCNPVFAESNADKPTPPAQASLNLSGLYLGFFPCADCQGIRTTLALNKNNNYTFITIYVGKSDREFVEKGKYTLGENNTLVLTPRKGPTTTQKYLIEDDVLIKLDEEGNRISKDNADGYVLKRKDVVKAPEGQHSGH